MANFQVYNTLGRRLEEFKSQQKKRATFYYCGPTVYWTQHIGNLRGSVCADVVHRTLAYFDYRVKMVRNYTDVGHLVSDGDDGEDKIAKGAKREGLSPDEIADKYIKIYEADTQDLNILEPTYKPRATKHIQEIIKMISKLFKKDFVYLSDLAVYFDISKYPDYGRLSGQKASDKLGGAGRGIAQDDQKKNNGDFAVWFFKAGEHLRALQTWDSPFVSPLTNSGLGFPGWHIECSAMAKKYLGETIDIHMGGIEHIPVHHENEIAQSWGANDGAKLANYWLHNEHLLVDNQKMSKSEGTSYSLAEIKDRGFDPLALRYFFLMAHYRSKQNFTWEALGAAENGFKKLKNKIVSLGSKTGKINIDWQNRFKRAIGQDFNVSSSLALLSPLLKSDLSEADKLATIKDFDKVWGLFF